MTEEQVDFLYQQLLVAVCKGQSKPESYNAIVEASKKIPKLWLMIGFLLNMPQDEARCAAIVGEIKLSIWGDLIDLAEVI